MEEVCSAAVFGSPKFIAQYVRAGLSIIEMIAKTIKDRRMWKSVWQKASFFAGIENWSKRHDEDPSGPIAIFDLVLSMFRSGREISSFGDLLKAKDCLELDYKAV